MTEIICNINFIYMQEQKIKKIVFNFDVVN
ncbi:MAG: hypothetical protein RLZZ161_1387 [Bacteroidota bacterium]|jgi:hypothetical protein